MTDTVPDGNAVFSINPLYRLQWEPAQNSNVLLYPEGMIQLNGPAGEILSAIDGERSVGEIIALLSSRYPDAAGIDADILEFLRDAHEQQWISL